MCIYNKNNHINVRVNIFLIAAPKTSNGTDKANPPPMVYLYAFI